MSGDRDAFAAMWLKDKGLYTGRIIAGNLCFEPDASVSRSEFLIACMKLAGLEQSDEAISTGFADELDTPRWQQPYLAAAYQSGMISGTPTEEGLVFRPEEDPKPRRGCRHAAEASAPAGRRSRICAG